MESIEKMTRKELVKYCNDMQIKGISNKNKRDLLVIITKHKQTQLLNNVVVEKKPLEIIKGSNQTKEWRKSCSWYKNGKSNECENYQKTILNNY